VTSESDLDQYLENRLPRQAVEDLLGEAGRPQQA